MNKSSRKNARAQRALLLVWCLTMFGATINAAPRIETIEPMGVVPGARTVVTFAGSGLESVSNLWTSFGAEIERVAGTNAGRVSFAIRCPPTASGIQAVQLIGSEGASGFQLVMIDHLEAVPGNGENRSAQKAMKLAPPIAVDAAVKSEKIDYYQISCKAGQSYSIEAIAHRIGSQMDPVVRVLDSDDKEVAFCDDEPSVWKDARFRFTAPLNGDYTIAVHDVGYGGGANYAYRLRVSNDPLVWFTFPLSDPAEGTVRFEAMGEGTVLPKPTSPANPPTVATFPGTPQFAEQEPNNATPANAPLAHPVFLNGKLETGGDADLYRFAAEKDERLQFKSLTRSLGSPCDLILRIKKEDGSVLAESDPGSSNDAALTAKFPTTGTYLLEVRELSGTSVSNAPYRVTIEKLTPGFTISTDDNIVELKRGKSAKLKFTADRNEFDGTIELNLETPIDGITLENNTIPEKRNEVEVTLKAEEKLPTNFYQQARFVASGKNASPVAVSTRTALRKAFPLMLNPPHFLDGLVTITVTDE